jgi:hypothetical protein
MKVDTAAKARSGKCSLPLGVHIYVQEGERLAAGDPLMDGPRDPHDILDVRGEIREVYLQGRMATTRLFTRRRG